MHPCPPWAETRVFSGHRRQAVGPEVRHYGDPRQIATARWVALFYCITIPGGTAAMVHRARRVALSELSEALMNLGQKGRGGGVLNRAHRPSRATWILFMIHDLHCRYPATRMNRYRICAMNFYIATDNILENMVTSIGYKWLKDLENLLLCFRKMFNILL